MAASSFVASSDSNSRSSCIDSNGNAESNPVPANFAEIIVVRHGETTWNASGKIQGHLDVELNEVGRQQAAAVADRLSKEFKISAIYTSDLMRAFETAQIIAKSCDSPEVIQDPALRERHLGDLQGVVYREAAKHNPLAHKAFVSHNHDQEIPAAKQRLGITTNRHNSPRIYSKMVLSGEESQGGGESLNQLYQRCTSSLERIAKKHKGEQVVVVTHGGTMRALFKRANPRGLSPGKVTNTSVSIFHISDSGWEIKVWADVSHLSETGFLASAFGGDKNSVVL